MLLGVILGDMNMLDFYFDSVVRKRQILHGPLAEHINGLAAEFQQASYARTTARRLLSIIGQFNGYMRLVGLDPDDIDEVAAARFLEDALVPDGFCREGPRAMRHLLGYLRSRGVIVPSQPAMPHPFATILEGFDHYLRDVRGLAPSTRQRSVAGARLLIDWLRERYGHEALTRLVGTDVLEFITERLSQYKNLSSRAHVGSQMRGFLKYLYASGTITTDLVRTVPCVSTPRLASLPRGLPWEEVRALIDGVDTSHPDGIRDKAILLLLATLGLRSGELRTLEFGHINWRTAEIRLPHTKTRRERVLPLAHEVGAALADYVLHGRPTVDVSQIFLRHGPRPGPMKTANTIIWIVRRHLNRAGLEHRHGGAHMLRHSLATRMVNAGVPIKSVADVLGHSSIDTTAIYTKVDTTTLATVALPFPGGAR
jgi:integrase/recombinase XerD